MVLSASYQLLEYQTFKEWGRLTQFPHSYKQISTPPPPIPLITVATAMLSVLQRGDAELWAEKSNVGKVVNRGCGVPDGFSVVPPYMNQRAVMFGQAGWGWC